MTTKNMLYQSSSTCWSQFCAQTDFTGLANSTVATHPGPDATTGNNQINTAKEPASNKSTDANMNMLTITMQQMHVMN
jgi:hypothetical protein